MTSDAMRFLGHALFSASLALGAPVLAAETARVVETHSISGERLSGTQGATHDLALHLFTFQGTRWLPGDIAMAVWEAMRPLDQCGIAFESPLMPFEVDGLRRQGNLSSLCGLSAEDRLALEHWLVGTSR